MSPCGVTTPHGIQKSHSIVEDENAEREEQKRAQKRAASKRWRDRNPEIHAARARRWHIKHTHGLTVEEYEAVFAERDGLCHMPGCEAKARCLDHDHESGRTRGALCQPHNTALGKLGDNIEGLERALAYLRRQRD